MREVADPQPPTLPQELINKIIYFCRRDPTALRSWCLVSSACLFDARKYLYWEISFVSYWRLQFGQFDWHLDWGRSGDFLASIKKNHQLPRLIRDLNFKLTDGPWSAQLWETFLVVFPTMTSLERFQYSCLYSDFGRPTLERLLCGTTMKLKEFEVFTNAPIDHLEYLPRFLQQQGDLEVLSLRCDWNLPALRPDACPRLHTLTTWSRRFIEAIIPGRPVVKLCWDLCQPIYFGVPGDYNETGYPVTVQLSRALSQIRILILRGTQSHGRLPLVAPHLPVLEVLDLEEFSEADVDGVLGLSSLRIFIMRRNIPLQHQRALAQRWFSSLATLQLLFFSNRSPDCFLRWARGAEEPVDASDTEASSFLAVRNIYSHQKQ